MASNSSLFQVYLLFIVLLTVAIVHAEPQNTGAHGGQHQGGPSRDVCLRHICPFFNPPSCKCPNSGLPQWNRRRRSLMTQQKDKLRKLELQHRFSNFLAKVFKSAGIKTGRI